VSVINPSDNEVIATITVGTEPSGVAFSPTGPDAGDIYVANQGSQSLSVIEP
jgi:DNA-binding beta-propeller fold protein YncE